MYLLSDFHLICSFSCFLTSSSSDISVLIFLHFLPCIYLSAAVAVSLVVPIISLYTSLSSDCLVFNHFKYAFCFSLIRFSICSAHQIFLLDFSFHITNASSAAFLTLSIRDVLFAYTSST